MTKEDKILALFAEKKGIIRLKDLEKTGINKYHLFKLIDKGEVEKIKHGLYKLSDYQSNEYYEVIKIVPKGVFCLFSAWNYHRLTSYLPHEYHIAIEKKSKIRVPDYPPLKLYYWENSSLKTGVVQVQMDDFTIHVFDLEKSVCDAVKFRNKIGKDILNEILSEYLKRKDKNLDLLIKYAQKLRVEKTLKNYLEILL